jgi:hypothetical protein
MGIFRQLGERRLVDYIKSLPDFVYRKVDPPYGHMGATVADSILQANNRYATVTPRIERILRRWPRETTVTAVLDLLKSVPAVQYLNWQGQDRADRFCDVLRLLKKEAVESEADFRSWLEKDVNVLKLHAIGGIGPETVDYFKIMVGLQGTAIDRRILKFLRMAGISTNAASPSPTSGTKKLIMKLCRCLRCVPMIRNCQPVIANPT